MSDFRGHMDMALAEARAAGARGEVPVGAAVLRDGRGDRARRQPDAGADRPHGACRDAGDPRGLQGAGDRTADRLRSLGHAGALPGLCGRDFGGAALAALLRRADPKSGGVAHGARVFDHPQAHFTPEVYGGIAEAEAAALMREFFAARRG
jgi:tRNA(adenine34) deaminase